MNKKFFILIITIMILPVFSLADESDSYNIFRQYKQEIVYPDYNTANNSLSDYNMYFGSPSAFGYDRYYDRHNYRHSSYYRNVPPVFYPPFYMMNNNTSDNAAEFYLRNRPKDTLVSPDEYKIFNYPERNK